MDFFYFSPVQTISSAYYFGGPLIEVVSGVSLYNLLPQNISFFEIPNSISYSSKIQGYINIHTFASNAPIFMSSMASTMDFSHNTITIFKRFTNKINRFIKCIGPSPRTTSRAQSVVYKTNNIVHPCCRRRKGFQFRCEETWT